ncbi:fatty acid desaturase [Streptomyces sp. NBC_01429]|uniref:fatty acid desaturase n=1 Tax=Streptomyces sp. NBC_01429 TaxID=2903862 RepID=UPI002E289C3E|nr:fatty acid desaturase [Streptomyces sp. NBC_01429]
MLIPLMIIVAGIVLRQVDRWWFSPARGDDPPGSLHTVMAAQRRRANDVTPVLLLAGHWLEVAGWWVLAVRTGPVGWVAVTVAVAVKFRHLQEVSHFAVHGVLTRSAKAGTAWTEATVHAPLGFVPVPVRREKHVRQHHPNATVAGVDPNLAELHRAGLLPGARPFRFALAVVHPLTPTGLAHTCRTLATTLRPRRGSWWRLLAFAAVPVAAGLLVGWPAALFGFLLPRLLLYPQLAWMSLLVEHRWFDAEPAAGSPAAIEAARCLRLYPRSPVLALLARGTWLPNGDLFHYAHSVHPAVRWNYLPALERSIGNPEYTPQALLLGRSAVIIRHHRALGGRRHEDGGRAPTKSSPARPRARSLSGPERLR